MHMRTIANQRGFSLIELMVAMTGLLLLIYAVNGFSVSQRETYAHQGKIVDAQQNIRVAMLVMSKEIRMAGYDPNGICLPDANSNSSPDGVSTSTSTTLKLNTCTATSTPTAYDTVEFIFDATAKTIMREKTPSGGSSGGSLPIAEGITGLTFTFYDASGTDKTGSSTQDDRDTIRSVNISITASTVHGATRTLMSDVGLRNMED